MTKWKKFISSPKVTLAAFGLAAGLLLLSTVGGARAALVDYSENHMTQIETQEIGVSLIEKTGENDSVRNPENLLNGLVAEGEKVKAGEQYAESLSVQNTGEIDQYVRVTVYKYWVDAATGEKNRNVYPGYIDLKLNTDDRWVVDESASTQERTVLYYTGILSNGETVEFANGLRIDPTVATIVTKNNTGVSYDYQGLEFRIKVDVDAVQTHNAEDAILSAWGKNVTVGEDGSLRF